jgi:hypothetical protein
MVTACKIYFNIQQVRHCTYKLNTKACLCNQCCCGKAVNITYSECVSVVLVIQHATHMRCIILPSVVCPALPDFSTLSHKWHDVREIQKKLLNTTCMFWFSLQLLSETFLILRRIVRALSQMYIGLHVMYLLFLSDFNQTWTFLTEFKKILTYQISWKYIKWEPSCPTWTDGQTWWS